MSQIVKLIKKIMKRWTRQKRYDQIVDHLRPFLLKYFLANYETLSKKQQREWRIYRKHAQHLMLIQNGEYPFQLHYWENLRRRD